jgi:hypothetical protein
MQSLIVTPHSQEELEQLLEYLRRAHISARVLSDEDKEDIALLSLMSGSDSEEFVSEEEIRKQLSVK